jgi:hypothetical protein
MTESATACARLSAIRSPIVGGSSWQARIAMLAIGTDTAAASASRAAPALDERHRFRERESARTWCVQVAAHGPRPFVVMRVGRQTAIGQVDAAPIEQCAAPLDRDEHRRVTVLGDADDRGSLHGPSRHLPLSSGQ